MPAVVNPTEEVGALVLTLAATAIGAKRASGAVDNVVKWDAAAGTLTLTAPVGTDAGGGTRRLVLAALGLDVTGTGQSSACLRVRAAGNSIEFGHQNPAGYGSTLGAESSTGSPYIAFSAEAGATSNTYRTRGLKPGIVRWNVVSSQFEWGTVASVNADSQAFTSVAFLTLGGALSISGALTAAVLTATGAASVGTTLAVSGALFAIGNVIIGAAAGGSTFDLSWSASAGASLQSYATKPIALNPLGNPVNISAPGSLTTINGTLSVGGAAQFNAPLTVAGTTSYMYVIVQNAGGNTLLGVEGSAGNVLTPGSFAYASLMGSNTATAIQFFTASVIRLTISSTGVVTTSGNFIANGLITAVGGVVINGGGFNLGAIYKDANYGIVHVGVAGAADQWSLFDTSGSTQLMHVKISETAMRFGGQIYPGTLTAFAQGTIGVYANYGLVLQCKTGVNHDFAIMNAASTLLLIANPTGTADLLFGGRIIVSGLPVGPAGATGTFYRASGAANSAVMVV